MFGDATGLPVLQQVLARTAWVREEDLRMDTDGPAWEYDLAIALGYGPRSWDGAWKLTRHPFTFRAGLIIACEVVYQPGTTHAIYDDLGTARTRLVVHRCPPGWNLVADSRITEVDTRYHLISPRDVQHPHR